MIRIANGQGFWGDWLEAPVRLVEQGPLDYLALDYLAEVTMSILQKQRSRDPSAGYARDFVEMIGRGAADIVDKNIRIVANAGGVNPEACRDAVIDPLDTRGILSFALEASMQHATTQHATKVPEWERP